MRFKAAVVGGLVAMDIAVVMLTPLDVSAPAMLVVVPAVAAAWLFGLRGAVVLGLLALPINIVAFALAGRSADLHLRDHTVWVGHALTLLLALTVGYLVGLRRALEAELQRSARAEKTLRETERARTQAEMDAQLLRADRLATVGTLAAGVAHEVNNPLTYLLHNSELALSEIDALVLSLSGQGSEAGTRLRELRETAEESHDGLQRIARVVRDLQSFAREPIERHAEVDLGSVVDYAIKITRQELRPGSGIERQLEPDLKTTGDEAQLVQVLVNLLINAAHAIPEARGHGLVTVTAQKQDGDVVVEVRDDGMGIAPEVHERMFDPFFTTKPVGVGTGLGMAVCKNIVLEHGGQIEVESEPGNWTCVRVILPRRDPQPDGSAPSPEAVSARRLRVLVVDDEPLVRKAIGRLLCRSHECEVASDGQEALELLLRNKRYDVVICDLVMPVMTGMDLYNRVRESDPELARRFVFLTGGAYTETSRRFVRDCDVPVHHKPLTGEALRTILTDATAATGAVSPAAPE